MFTRAHRSSAGGEDTGPPGLRVSLHPYPGVRSHFVHKVPAPLSPHAQLCHRILHSLPDLLCVEDNKSTGKISELLLFVVLKRFTDEDCITFLKPEERQPSEDMVPAIPHFSWQLPQIRALENSFYFEVNTITGRMTQRGMPVPTPSLYISS